MMDLFNRWLKKLYLYGLEYFQLYYSVYRATCMDNEDPEEQGRIRVRVPAVSGSDTIGNWAWPITPWAGRDSGSFVVPDVNDPVYVMFENGKADYPMWMGGWWPKPGGDNFAEGLGAYKNGKPTKRIFKTKAGHELSFEDDPETLSCKLVWHNPAEDQYSFFAFTKDGSVQMANHQGAFMEFRTKDGDELVMIMDKTGNQFSMNKDGTKLVDQNGNLIELKKGAVQILSPDAVVVNAPSINLKTGGVDIGDIATDEAVKGTTFLAWWKAVFLVWLNTHIHPTGVGPSGPAQVPAQAPVDKTVLTQKLKMQ